MNMQPADHQLNICYLFFFFFLQVHIFLQEIHQVQLDFFKLMTQEYNSQLSIHFRFSCCHLNSLRLLFACCFLLNDQVWKWDKLCTFPKGHPGTSVMGKNQNALRERSFVWILFEGHALWSVCDSSFVLPLQCSFLFSQMSFSFTP